jgi:NAD(P)-dependent dehydrogenase (short-subunit alcohol dehydrogenase family)
VKKGNSGIYSKSAYGTSKMMLNAWARFILKKQLKDNQVVICMSPGHCQTDMGGKDRAPRTSMQGA